MRATTTRAVLGLAVCLASCFPDADKLRGPGGGGTGATGATGATGGSGFTGPGGTAGGTAGVGGTAGIGGNGGIGGVGGTAGVGGDVGGTAGGGTGGTGMPPPDPARDQICDDYGMAVAAKSFACAPFLSAFRFGTHESYAVRLAMNCRNFGLPAVRFPPMPIEPCLIALDAQPCDEWIDGTIPAECRVSGALPAGAVCATGLQCSTDLCDVGANGCGRCIASPTAGQACSHGVCAYPLECSQNNLCVMPAALGAACSTAAPCRPSLACHAGACAVREKAGAACAADDECDIYGGAVCNTNMGLCIGADTGPMCGPNPDGTVTLCAGNAACHTDGTCLAPAADGAACTTATTGPGCIWPALCGNDGRCHVPTPVRTCGTAAPAPADPRRALRPAGGVVELWRSTLPRHDLP